MPIRYKVIKLKMLKRKKREHHIEVAVDNNTKYRSEDKK